LVVRLSSDNCWGRTRKRRHILLVKCSITKKINFTFQIITKYQFEQSIFAFHVFVQASTSNVCLRLLAKCHVVCSRLSCLITAVTTHQLATWQALQKNTYCRF
jgi:hypothetical protein